MPPVRRPADPRRTRAIAEHRYMFPLVREIPPSPLRREDDRTW